MDSDSLDATTPEVFCRPIRMPLRGAEDEGPCPSYLRPCLKGRFCPSFVGESVLQLLGIEAAISPWDGLEIHRISDPAVVEGCQQALLDTLDQVDFSDEIVLAQTEEIGTVSPERCRSEAQEEVGTQMVDDLAVRVGCSVVEFVDDDVVKAF